MIKANHPDFLEPIDSYYSSKIKAHGATPHGVDWNSSESQTLRFEQLSKIIDSSEPFSVNDLGCGYGAYYDYLITQYRAFSYMGIDISHDMIRSAQSRYHDDNRAQFVVSNKPTQTADYSVASGIFNVCLNHSKEEWLSYIKDSLDTLNDTSRHGFAFNCLTIYSDQERMRDHLYYADPTVLFDLCKQRYSRNIALLHDYDLYEFTLLIRKFP